MGKQAPLRLLTVHCGIKDTTKAHVHPRNVDDTRLVFETHFGRKRVRIAKFQRKLALKKRQLILKVDNAAAVLNRQETRAAKSATRKKYREALKKDL